MLKSWNHGPPLEPSVSPGVVALRYGLPDSVTVTVLATLTRVSELVPGIPAMVTLSTVSG